MPYGPGMFQRYQRLLARSRKPKPEPPPKIRVDPRDRQLPPYRDFTDGSLVGESIEQTLERQRVFDQNVIDRNIELERQAREGEAVPSPSPNPQ